MLDRMSWPLRDRCCLVLGDGVVHLLRQQTWTWQPAAQVLETVPIASRAGMDAVSEVLQSLLAKWSTRGRGLHIVLGADWVQFARIEPPSDARHPRDLEAAATMQLRKMLDSTAAETATACDPFFQLPFIGCAVERALLEALVHVAAARHMPLYGVAPEFSLVWNHWCKALQPGEWLGMCTRKGLTLGLVANGRLQAVRHKRQRWDAGTSPEWLNAAVTQEALRCRVPDPAGLALCGQVPASWGTKGETGTNMRVLGDAADALAVLGVPA